MQSTEIQWTEKSWNPVRGCTRVSEGCTRCYAERQAARYSGPGLPFEGFAINTPAGPRWTGKVELIPEKLGEPLRMRKPAMIFTNSMSDLFHEGLSNDEIAAVFGVMAACPQHVFQVLTKRPARMLAWFGWVRQQGDAAPFGDHLGEGKFIAAQGVDWVDAYDAHPWPLPNVWLGVSCEDQATADDRIPLLLQCPAAVRWISAEPLLGPIDLARYLPRVEVIYAGREVRYRVPVNDDIVTRQLPKMRAQNPDPLYTTRPEHEGDSAMHPAPFLDWVVVGGESGPGARPMHPDWARLLQNQCETAGVPFFFKQWGNWIQLSPSDGRATHVLALAGKCSPRLGRPITECLQGGGVFVGQLGKRDAGRMLDGQTWDQMPASRQVEA